MIDLLELTGAVLIIVFGTLALAGDELTIGGLLAFLAYLSQLYRPVRDLPIMREPTGYTVEKTKDGKVIYRDPDGNQCPKDEALRSTSSNYGGRA